MALAVVVGLAVGLGLPLEEPPHAAKAQANAKPSKSGRMPELTSLRARRFLRTQDAGLSEVREDLVQLAAGLGAVRRQ